MTRVLFALISLAGFAAAQSVPTPELFFGFKIGADKKLARYDKIVDYLHKVAEASPRVHVRTIGPTTQNNPFVIVEISSEENMRDLDRYKTLERKLYFQNDA